MKDASKVHPIDMPIIFLDLQSLISVLFHSKEPSLDIGLELTNIACMCLPWLKEGLLFVNLNLPLLSLFFLTHGFEEFSRLVGG